MIVELLLVSINDSEIDSERIESEVKKASLSHDLSFNFSCLGESIEIPTELERAAPWHVCSVSKELEEIGARRCYSLNYCLMYVIDEVEKLSEEHEEYDYFVLLFPNPPTREGDFLSFRKNFVCAENDIENIINQLSILANRIEESNDI